MTDKEISDTLDMAYKYIIPSVERVDPRLASDIARLADIASEQRKRIDDLTKHRD